MKNKAAIKKKSTETKPRDTQVFLAILGLVQFAPAILLFLELFPSLVQDHVKLFVVGVALVTIALYTFYAVLWKTLKLRDPLGLLFTGIVFTAYLDLFISLCLIFPTFVLGRFYLDKGEKYFTSSYGFCCLFWDATFQFTIQFILAFRVFTKREYHFTGLVWAGSIINSMAPLLLGAAIGPYSGEIQMATALNTPYVFFPVGVAIYLLSTASSTRSTEGPGTRVRSHNALVDIVLICYNFFVPMIHIVRAMCVLGSQSPVVRWWVKIEPLFDRTNLYDTDDQQDFAFMQVQVLQWAFWFVPWHWAALYEQLARIHTNKRTIVLGAHGADFAAIAFGGYLQSMACHFTSSYFDMEQGKIGLVVSTNKLPQEFWLVNIATLIGALLHFTHFHIQDVEEAVKQD